MAEFNNENTGALFVNKKKETEKHPDRTGTINVDGVDYWLSGWLKKAKDGSQYLSLAVKLKEQKNSAPEKKHSAPKDDFPDDLPFRESCLHYNLWRSM